MDVYLGLGSNLGDRRSHLVLAVELLANEGVEILARSPIVESAALLPPGADPHWNRPYLNAVVRCVTKHSPDALLGCIKQIESQFGRKLDGPRWAPRPIDIDILLWGQERLRTAKLEIPHPGLTKRNFVLAPLAALSPGLKIPGPISTQAASQSPSSNAAPDPSRPPGSTTVLGRSRVLKNSIPLWMGIINLTPDSFSDGGELLGWDRLEARVDSMLEAGVQIIDVGAESTRPGATALDADEEWSRLEPVLARLIDKLQHLPWRPQLSLDTYHPAVARRALEAGVDIINDVGGLTSPEMIELAASGSQTWIAMHSVTVPVERNATLPTDRSPADCIRAWLAARREQWDKAGIDHNRVIVDPGIGFGKTPLQDLALLRDIAAWQPDDQRVLIGHSRKSFMTGFASKDQAERDLVTIGASLQLCAQGIDILRVHNVPAHVAAWRGWTHLDPALTASSVAKRGEE